MASVIFRGNPITMLLANEVNVDQKAPDFKVQKGHRHDAWTLEEERE